MAIKGKRKKKLIEDSQRHKKDTGSPEVQIKLLTVQVTKLTAHLKDHKKDQSARKGLLGMVARRRDLLVYLKRNDPKKYEKTLEDNKLKR